MKSRRVYNVIRQFSKEDHQDFGDFIRSPFHNGQQILTEIWDLMEKKLFIPNPPDMTPEDFHGQLRPGKPYNYNFLTKNLSNLLAKFHEFLIWRELQHFPETQEKLLLKSYRRSQVLDELPWLYKKSKKRLREVEGQRVDFFSEAFELEYELGQFLFAKARNPEDLEDFFQTPDAHLDHYYYTRKLQMAIGVHAYNRMFNKAYAVTNLDWILAEMEQRTGEFPEIARIYFNVYGLMLDYENRKQFLELKKILLNPALSLDLTEQRTLLGLLLNLCFRNVNQGKAEYEPDTMEIYDYVLETGILLQEGKLLPADLKNIISLKCDLGKAEEAESLLHKYAGRLTDGHEGYAVKYNEAQIAFARREFSNCFRIMDEVVGGFKDDVFYSLGGRVYMLKCLFEKACIKLEGGDLDFIDVQIRNFLQYLDRFRKVSEARRFPHRNFTYLLKKARNCLFLPGKIPLEELNQLCKEVEETVPLSVDNRRWLLNLLKTGSC